MKTIAFTGATRASPAIDPLPRPTTNSLRIGTVAPTHIPRTTEPFKNFPICSCSRPTQTLRPSGRIRAKLRLRPLLEIAGTQSRTRVELHAGDRQVLGVIKDYPLSLELRYRVSGPELRSGRRGPPRCASFLVLHRPDSAPFYRLPKTGVISTASSPGRPAHGEGHHDAASGQQIQLIVRTLHIFLSQRRGDPRRDSNKVVAVG